MNTDTLILSGEGYTLTICQEAETSKRDLLVASSNVCKVTNNDESADAAYVMRSLAQMRIMVDKGRKDVKEPVLRIGKLIDASAKTFLLEIESEEARLRKLIGDHASEVARIAAIKAEEERKAFEIARAAREAAAAAQDAAEASGKISDVIAAKQAEQARQETLGARMDASSELAATKVADGVRFAWDFEVDDIDLLLVSEPNLVELTFRRSEILQWLKGIEAENDRDPIAIANACGIRAFKKPVVSSR
jgi:hypothetical protein